MQDIKTYYEHVKELGWKVCEQLLVEMDKLGLKRELISPRLERASFEMKRDPSTGENSLIGIWRDKNGLKQGEIIFHSDGSFFAEYDVVCEHPKNTRWFVESVTAWGNTSLIKSDPRLLPVAS